MNQKFVGLRMRRKFLRVMYAYLNNRIRVTKVCSYYSEILDIILGVPQGSL